MASEQSIMSVIRAARPTFRNPHDKTAFAVHAAFSAAGYVLHATGLPAFDDEALSTSSTDEVGIENWNEVEDSYAFVYSKTDSKGSQKVLVKSLVLNDKLVTDVLKEGSESLLHLELDVNEYAENNGGSNYASQFKNLGKLADKINKDVLDKLNPTSSGPWGQSQSSGTSLRDSRARPGVEGFYTQDPYASNPGVIIPPIPGFGGSDLVPGPAAGMYPTRGDFGGGGMLVGPNDPRFFGGGARQPGFPGGGGLGAVPPGARFDPFGPPDVPGFEPNRFTRGPRRPPGQHPDLEQFPGGGDFI